MATSLRAPPRLDLTGLTLVVGLGKSGLSAIRALTTLGAQLAVTDSRAEPPGLAALQQAFPALPRHLGGFAAAPFAQAARIVLSPGVSLQTPAIADAQARGVPIWGDIELFARLNPAPCAAITGSNGKSTVTSLLGLMAETAGRNVAVGGNLGVPALELWLNKPDAELYVLELSSFQLETTASLNARAATVLNISPDHLDRYANLGDYSAAKQRVFRGDGWMILNADDPAVAAMAQPGRQTRYFTLGEPADGEFGLRRRSDMLWLAYGEQHWIAANELKIAGAHNLANALAALALGQVLELPRPAMLEALRAFPGLPHRSQLVAEIGGVRWINDSKGTNVGATVAAVNGLPGPLVLIAGGDGKNQDFAPLRAALQGKVRSLVLIGRDGPAIAAAVGDALPLQSAVSMEQAVALAARLARPGDSVVLSPACASFDMFANYEERGAAFAAAARRLAEC